MQEIMKYLIKTVGSITLILMSCIFFITCSEDTIDEVIAEPQTFLEKNDGTQWLLSNKDITVYIRINNDNVHLIEQWRMSGELDCYNYNANIFNPGYYTIKENSANKLVIDCDPVLGDCECMTFSKQGNTLTVDIKISEWEEETVLFNVSSVQVDDLQKCDIDPENNQKFYN